MPKISCTRRVGALPLATKYSPKSTVTTEGDRRENSDQGIRYRSRVQDWYQYPGPDFSDLFRSVEIEKRRACGAIAWHRTRGQKNPIPPRCAYVESHYCTTGTIPGYQVGYQVLFIVCCEGVGLPINLKATQASNTKAWNIWSCRTIAGYTQVSHSKISSNCSFRFRLIMTLPGIHILIYTVAKLTGTIAMDSNANCLASTVLS